MKKIFLLLGIAAAALVSCAKFDDVALWNKSMDMDARLSCLEDLCEQFNSEISSMQTIVTALEENDCITSVVPVIQNGETVGYTISFTNSSPITIYHGKKGDQGEDGYTPVIGVKQDTDGHYYWTLDGDWLTDDSGNKVKADGHDGKDGDEGDGQNPAGPKDEDGIIPKLKIENGYWYVSYDGGQTWSDEPLGKAIGENGNDGANGDSFFRDVDNSNPDYVTFILADGTEILIPRYSALSIEFDMEGPVTLLPHSSLKIGYTIITEETSNLSIEAISSADLKVAVSKTTETTGTLDIISGESVDEFSRVLVLVSNGEKTIMKSLSFGETSGLRVTNGLVREVPAAGEDVEIKVETQMEYVVSIPESDKDWIGHVSTRAWRQESIILTVAENKGGQRSSLIDLKDETGQVLQSVQIIQSAAVSGPDPENLTKIYYKSTDGQIVRAYSYRFDANIISNTYVDNQGVIEFDKTVTSIGDDAFKGCISLQEIIIPGSVTSIGSSAFENCTSLQQITIPNSVTSIGDDAFKGCISLQEITIPNSVTSIGFYAFQNCTSLQQISISNSVTSIGFYVFEKCTSLQEISIPNSVTSIESSAFMGCTGLQQVTLSDNLISIGSSVFYNCAQLQQITLPNNLTSIGDMAFSGCISLQEIIIPDSVTSIGARAFWQCTSLRKVTLPGRLISIGVSAFESCTSLQEITIPGAISIGTNVFIDKQAFKGCINLQQIKLPDNLTSLGDEAFGGCTRLQQITLPDNLTSIGSNVFKGCTRLQQVILPGSLKSIGSYAFEDCTSLQEITFPDSITSIAYCMFSGCTSLQQVTIPDSVTSIEVLVFNKCTNLAKIYCRPTVPPEIPGTGFGSLVSNAKIYVPQASVEAYKTDINWSRYASMIVGYDF